MQRWIESIWYRHHPLSWLLWPCSLIYCLIITLRRFYLTRFCQQKNLVPIIVVGNITVGGVGKTPLVIALAKQALEKGLRVGIVSRGYGATTQRFPHKVALSDSAYFVGDEPLLIAQKVNCPVVIAPKRMDAVNYLLENYQSQLIISDDGLQHYAMGRAIEIIVIDGERSFGNGMCLPAGPLREQVSRLKKADFIVINGGDKPCPANAHTMILTPGLLTALTTGVNIVPNALVGPVAAIAAIGHPKRFFTTLAGMGVVFTPYCFADHHQFSGNELIFSEKYVVMTEKDAVKCRAFATANWYFLPVVASLSDRFWQRLWSHEQLKGLSV
jgi:tetraacyldisaccharide 4'-kinase